MRTDLRWDLATVVAAAALTLWVATRTAIGPTVLDLTATHGIHEGDLAAGLVAFGLAGLVIGARHLAD